LNILHFGARENHPEICRIGLNHGVPINVTTKVTKLALNVPSGQNRRKSSL